MLVVAGRLDEARAELRNLMAMQERPSPGTATDLATIDLLSGRNEAALQAASSWPPGTDRDFVLAMASHALRQDDSARAAEARLVARTDTASAIRLAEIHAHRGNRDEAFRWLNLAFDRMGPRPWLTDQWPALDYSPFLVSLRSDARWEPTVLRSLPPGSKAPAPASG
jgi:hypothetical protein